LSIEDELLGDNVAGMTACSTDENLILGRHRMPRPLAAKLQSCNKSLERCIIYPLSHAAPQRFIAALGNLTRPWIRSLDSSLGSLSACTVLAYVVGRLVTHNRLSDDCVQVTSDTRCLRYRPAASPLTR